MDSFCTIITSDYLFYVKTLSDSLKKSNSNLDLKVLVVDDNFLESDFPSIEIFYLLDMESVFPEDYKRIQKYKVDLKSSFRWALKPLFLKFLFFQKMEKVVYVDPDVYFFSDPNFLFSELNKADVLLTPHWRSRNPLIDKINFELLFSGGIFNAGFFGCNKNSIEILNWWLEACSFKMTMSDGFYVDQAYLNLLPVYFGSQVKILEHQGCNVSSWNKIECRRVLKDNELLINDKFPIVFIHFTNGTIRSILRQDDIELLPYLKEYERALQVHKPDFSFILHNEEKLAAKKKGIFKWFPFK